MSNASLLGGGGGITIGDTVISGTPRHNLFIDENGLLADTMSATNVGVLFDGDTNPYTGEFFDISNAVFTRTIGDNDGNPVNPTVLAAILSNPYSPSGSVLLNNIGILSQVTVAGGNVDGNEYNWGIRTVVQRTGTISGSSLVEFQTVGLSTVVAASQDYQNVSLDVNEVNIGHDIVVSATTPLGTFAALSKNSYGTKIAVYGSSDAFNFIYGLYIFDVSGPDIPNCRAIYSVPDVASYIRGDLGINTETFSGQLSQVIDTSTRIGHYIRGAASQSGSYISCQDSSSNDAFYVSPNTSAANPTLYVQTLFDSADSVVARFAGPNRATPTHFDRGSIEFYLDNSAGTQSRFAEVEFVAQTNTSGGRYGGLFFNTDVNSSNINVLALGQSTSGGVGFLVNNSKIDMDVRYNTVTTTGMFYIDGGLDAVQFTPTTARASAAGATWDGFDIKAATATISGSTNITTATGFNLVNIARPTATSGSALTITNAATVYIANSPLQAGSTTITNPYSLWIDAGASRFDGNMDFAADGTNFIFGTGTGCKIGTATGQKIGFWNATPIIQPTTGVAAATFVANTSGIANDTATFDGYTLGQVVKALRNAGLLA